MPLFSWLFKKTHPSQVQGRERPFPGRAVLPSALSDKMELIRPYIDKNQDLVCRSFALGSKHELQAAMVYLDGTVDSAILDQNVIRPLIGGANGRLSGKDRKHLLETIGKNLLTVGKIHAVGTLSALVRSIFDGFTVVMVDGVPEALVIDIHGGKQRAIEEPDDERTLRGSREGFIEDLVVNISLIRRKLRDPNLVVEKTIVGRRTRTDVAIVYIEDIADPKIVDRVRTKIGTIDIDGMVATGYIEQFIEDRPYSLFPQMRSTERPDKLVAALLEGRIAVLANGTPWVLIVPSILVEFLHGSEDYYERAFVGTFFRLLRYAAFFLAVSLPALYIALLSFRPDLIPFNLIVPIAMARKEVPFPVVIEVLLFTGVVELIAEAGLRMPSPIGQTTGVVGGIILGQAVIAAKLASPMVIITVSLTIISTYAIPTQSMVNTVRLLRLIMIAMAASFGLFGLSIGWLLLLAHLADLDSLGIPYLAPLAPTRYGDLKDTLFRTFLWKMNRRPESIPSQDKKRQGNGGRKR